MKSIKFLEKTEAVTSLTLIFSDVFVALTPKARETKINNWTASSQKASTQQGNHNQDKKATS